MVYNPQHDASNNIRTELDQERPHQHTVRKLLLFG